MEGNGRGLILGIIQEIAWRNCRIERKAPANTLVC
jgi:hypothetical protein